MMRQRFVNGTLNIDDGDRSVDRSVDSRPLSALSRQDNFSLSSSTPTIPNRSRGGNNGIYMQQPSPMNSSIVTDKSNKLKKPSTPSTRIHHQQQHQHHHHQVISNGQLPHHKAGRMKVGLRCRPPFQDEIEYAEKNQGQFMPILENKSETQDHLGQVSLTMISGKQREFLYDYVFGPSATQDEVYNKIGRPVVTDVLNGFNGTIFAYGQTGTGKTYTMGILEFVEDDQAGIIPRALSQIFDYVDSHAETEEVVVTLSFLQLYRETIQDLLAPANGTQVGDDNLLIREDPQKGFYVEGLQDFIVRSYHEAEALLNLGLENRAIAPTLMNSTSSRSHTILTLNIEQRGQSEKRNPSNPVTGRTKYARTVRSKLLMVDLAGSERVRRTVSKGARLSEAKSINTSLSALGNVIAALAEHNTSHIPYRDSKLTRLLQDSLGGTASTALVATVGPAAINYGETLSTLLFATRCMAVKTTPIQHEEVDYADLCVRLQERISTLEGSMTEHLLAQQSKYDAHIRDLRSQLETKKDEGNGHSSIIQPTFDSSGFNALMSSLSKDSNKQKEWLFNGNKDVDNNDFAKLLAYLYQVLRNIASDSTTVLEKNMERAEQFRLLYLENISVEAHKQAEREKEINVMENNDPNGSKHLESHLLPLSHVEAMIRVQTIHSSNNETIAGLESSIAIAKMSMKIKNNFNDYESIKDLSEAVASLHGIMQQNIQSISTIMARKDEHYHEIKKDMTGQLVERRKREEEVMNWSFILKHLLSTTSKLKRQLQRERQQQAALTSQQEGNNTYREQSGSSPLIKNDNNYNNNYNNNHNNSSSNNNNNNSNNEALSPLDRVQIRMGHMKTAVEEDKRREGQQGRLGPRLANNQHAINVNKASAVDAIEDIDQLGPPEDDDEIDQLDQLEPEPIFIPTRERRGKAPSTFAQEVAMSLNVVESNEAAVTMDVVDTVTNMTLEQIRLLSPGTRAQVMEIRKELGLNNFQMDNRGRQSTPQQGSSQKFFTPQQGNSNNQKLVPKRASSAERNSTSIRTPGRLPNESHSVSDLREMRYVSGPARPKSNPRSGKKSNVVYASNHLEKVTSRSTSHSYDYGDYSQLDDYV